MHRLKRLLPKTGFARALTLVAGGTAVGQAVGVVVVPALSRLCSPAEFGVLAIYTSLTTLCAVVGSFGYHQAIPIPEDDDTAANVLAVALVAVVSTGIVCALAAFCLRNHVDAWTQTSGFSNYLWLVPLGLIGQAGYDTLMQWAIRKKAFAAIARTSVTRSLSQSLVQLLGGFVGMGATGLVCGQLVGQWAGSLRVLKAGDGVAALQRASIVGARAAASRFRRYPLLTLPNQVVNAIDRAAPALLLTHYFGGAVTGHLALGDRALSIPFMLIGTSAQKVFFASGAKAKQEGRLHEETESTLRLLLRVAVPPVVVIAAAAPELFAVAFGPRWREAGIYAQWLSARAGLSVVAFPLTPLLYVTERQGAALLFTSVQLGLRLGAVLVGAWYADARLAIMLLGLCSGVLWLSYLGYLWKVSGNPLRHGAALLGKELAMALPLALPILIARRISHSDIAVTVVAVFAGLAALSILFVRSRGQGPSKSTA